MGRLKHNMMCQLACFLKSRLCCLVSSIRMLATLKSRVL